MVRFVVMDLEMDLTYEFAGVARPNEIQHVLRHSIHTNDDLQLLMHKRQGGYSRVERWMGTKANPAHDNGGGSSSASIGNWATAKQLIAAVPRLEDNCMCRT
jgi:hypothetical protein